MNEYHIERLTNGYLLHVIRQMSKNSRESYTTLEELFNRLLELEREYTKIAKVIDKK